jgi:DNA-binding response OmpR family regulator
MQLGRILWVDDEVDSLQSQQIFLTQKGYEVVTFTNGYDAVEYLGSSAIDNAIDVVLLDETMPGNPQPHQIRSSAFTGGADYKKRNGKPHE